MINMVLACVLIRTRHGEFDKVVGRIKDIEGVNCVFPVLGRWDVVVSLKATNNLALGNSILKISRMAGVVFTETLIEVQREE